MSRIEGPYKVLKCCKRGEATVRRQPETLETRSTKVAGEAEIQALQRNVAAIKERLDYIEDHLVQMSKAGVGVGYAPSTSNIPPEVLELARAGKRLDAVAKYRELTSATLDQATRVVAGI